MVGEMSSECLIVLFIEACDILISTAKKKMKDDLRL